MRYLLFVFETSKPNGGIYDLVIMGDELPHLKKYSRRYTKDIEYNYTAQIFDNDQGKIVWQETVSVNSRPVHAM